MANTRPYLRSTRKIEGDNGLRIFLGPLERKIKFFETRPIGRISREVQDATRPWPPHVQFLQIGQIYLQWHFCNFWEILLFLGIISNFFPKLYKHPISFISHYFPHNHLTQIILSLKPSSPTSIEEELPILKKENSPLKSQYSSIESL